MLVSSEEMYIKKFGRLRIKISQSIFSGSNRKETWICDCGKEKLIIISDVISGHTTSCGRCNEISEEEMKIKKFGRLRMKFPKAILLNATGKTRWICDCGKEKLIIISDVISGHTTSCGRCNEISEEKIKFYKFGKLRMKFPKIIKPGSGKKEIWICDCGNEKEIIIRNVLSRKTISCGDCYSRVYIWYLKNKDMIRSLKCPIIPSNFPLGGPVPLEIIKKAGSHFECICSSCLRKYHPRLADIRLGISLTCGCSTYRISSGQKDVSLFIELLGFETRLEHKINKLSYDIFVPSANLLIEYNGIRWHSMKGSKERDQKKEENAVKYGYEFFSISENEWLKDRKKIENQLMTIGKVI